MNKADILSHVDHTLLAATASWTDIQAVCQEAIDNQTASVCLPPSYVARVHDTYGNRINICTVIGFPLGYSVTDAKVAEVKAADAEGANEFDMVVNLGDVKNGAFDRVAAEIAAVKRAAGSKIVKVIVETCYLTEAEKIALCRCVTEGGADYIKTSTGFGTAGATVADVALFRAHIGPHVKIKAAGGIRSRQDMVDYLNQGCDRLGTSSAVKILAGEESGGY